MPQSRRARPAAAPRRRAARLEPDTRRAQILQCAMRVTARVGAQAATAATVAAEAKVSEATVFKYFPDKRSLTLAVIETLGAHFRAVFDRIASRGRGAVDVLVDYAVAFAAELERQPEFARLLMNQGAVLLDTSLRQVIENNLTQMARRIEKIIRRGIAEGAIKDDVDPEMAAWIYVGAYTAVAQAKIFGRPPEWMFRVMITSVQGLLGTAVAQATHRSTTTPHPPKGAPS
jgi:AcrR family transcriptional regulator